MAYQYDASGTRVLSAGNGINKLEFTAANGLLLYEINLNNNVATKHLYLGRNKLADIENGNVTYYHSDPVSSPLAATDASGNLLWRTSYRPYGERLTGGDGGKNKEWFGGKPYEDATGLSYFGARWYDPILGRFAAMDPVDWSEANPVHSFNRYGYANNNPYKFVDPDGREVTLSPVTVHSDPTYGQNIGNGGCSPCQQRAEANRAIALAVTQFIAGAVRGFKLAVDFILTKDGEAGAGIEESDNAVDAVVAGLPSELDKKGHPVRGQFVDENGNEQKAFDSLPGEVDKNGQKTMPDGSVAGIHVSHTTQLPTLHIHRPEGRRDIKVRYGRKP